ncbi:Ada metal-binding domain-containing protein [uncultured Alteromonas sp.]|uniref:Ada metal-binding domain-containing protein n=1 Tax=uncultured Alteromonas sp. TaxID=179113 RepID=UPI0025EE8DA0|nr:Ada metal-binding domain-containing protein [uncultured Alteromonas sp.]
MLDAALQQQYAAARQSRDPRFDGRFFVAVKTTGIFCRPVCPARIPDEKNVAYYHYAQQAVEQGYRPCLRCRPDSAPGSFAWRGVNTTTQRAMRLLSEALDESVQGIAARLGISERYLGQLLKQEVGMSPKRFQLHSRLLLAKRLLQQTAMPVGDVALACGFQSSRSLQSHLKKDFALTAGDIRKASGNHTQASILTLFLPVRQPYNWPQVRDFLKLRALTGIECVDTQSYRRTFSFNDEPGLVRATFDQQQGGFTIEAEITRPQYLQPLLINLRRVLDMDTDPHNIGSALVNAGLKPEQLTNGLRLPGVWSVFEAGCRAIIGQQISIRAAITQLQRLSDELGAKHPHGFAFPLPERVASSSLEMLRMPAARKQAIRDFAELVAANPNEALTDNDILAIKGIGPWTLQYIKLRGSSEPDIYLEKDLIVARQAQHYAIDASLAAPWRSYLTIQLWLLANQPTGEN